jgi:DNA-binding NarL/FixJ family response regulator
MEFMDLKFLIFTQIGIDIVIIIVFILLIKKISFFKRNSSLNKGLDKYESMLCDAVRISEQFKDQLEEKKHMIKMINQHLEKRITSLNMMLNRTDALLFHNRQYDNLDRGSLDNQKKQILKLEKQGHSSEQIADTLSIPREEVMLVLELKKKDEQQGSKEGVS